MSIKWWSSLLLPFALGATLSSHALGQADAHAASLALFQEAEKLLASGDTAAACRKYSDSYSLEPQLDALLRWGDCLEKEGKLASAYGAFQDAVELGQRGGDSRWSLAESRAKLLRPRLSYITIEVPRERQLSTLSVERDGFRLGSSAWGVPIPIDPGRHTLRASAYGYREWQTTIEISVDGAAPFVEVPMLERLPDVRVGAAEPAVASVAPQPAPAAQPPAPVATSAVSAAPVDRSSAKDTPARSKLGPTRIAALAAGGIGLVGLGAGFYFLAETSSTLEERDGICPSGQGCEPGTNQRLAELTRQARASQRTEIICFALGGAAVAVGLGLWLMPKPQGSAPRRAALVAPVVQPGGGGLLLQGEL